MNKDHKRVADCVLISRNPKAGRNPTAAMADRLRECLVSRGYNAEVLTDLDAVGRRANELFQAGRLKVLVGVGGDGTAAELANRTVPGTPITLLPAGTANLIAKEYRLPSSPEKSAEMIDTGSTLTLDAGRANGRLFLVLMSAGIDADIVERVHARRETSFRANNAKGGHIGYHSYIAPVFESVAQYTYPGIQVVKNPDMNGGTGSPEEKTLLKPFKWVFLYNIPRYGFGCALAVDCFPGDGQLDFCGFRRRGLFSSLANLFFAQFGLHRFLPNTGLAHAERFRFEAVPGEPSARIPYQLDGDPCGFLPVEIEAVPKRFTILVPFNVAKRHLKKGEAQWRKLQAIQPEVNHVPVASGVEERV